MVEIGLIKVVRNRFPFPHMVFVMRTRGGWDAWHAWIMLGSSKMSIDYSLVIHGYPWISLWSRHNPWISMSYPLAIHSCCKHFLFIWQWLTEVEWELIRYISLIIHCSSFQFLCCFCFRLLNLNHKTNHFSRQKAPECNRETTLMFFMIFVGGRGSAVC